MGVADLVGMAEDRRAMCFREPDGSAEVVDVSVRQQNRVDVVDAEPEFADRVDHVVALAGEPGVDDDDAAAVGDQGPVHEFGVGEVHGVGDGRQLERSPCRQSRGARSSSEGWHERDSRDANGRRIHARRSAAEYPLSPEE